jgi:hypothetical protein
MNTRALAAFAVGIGAIVLIVAGVLFMQRGARIRVTGQILKVRTAPLDDGSSVAVADFRVSNPGKLFVVVRSVRLFVEDASGNRIEGQTVSEIDARRLFEAIPLLGQKYNDTLVVRDKVPSGASLDRMIAARFEMPIDKLDSRKQVFIEIEDVDGPVSEITGK